MPQATFSRCIALFYPRSAHTSRLSSPTAWKAGRRKPRRSRLIRSPGKFSAWSSIMLTLAHATWTPTMSNNFYPSPTNSKSWVSFSSAASFFCRSFARKIVWVINHWLLIKFLIFISQERNAYKKLHFMNILETSNYRIKIRYNIFFWRDARKIGKLRKIKI